jgi:hypothetical protein
VLGSGRRRLRQRGHERQQAQTQQLGAASDADLAEDVLDVQLGRAAGDVQMLGALLDAVAEQQT